MTALFAAMILSQAYYTPDEAQALFRQANDAFYKDPADYAQAKALYLKLIEHGHASADVLFNLGTTCLAAGDLGDAVLYLERARRVQKSDDIEANLAVAHHRQGDQVVEGAAASEPFLERVADATDDRSAAWICLASIWGAFGLLLLFRRMMPGTRTWVALSLAFCCAIAVI